MIRIVCRTCGGEGAVGHYSPDPEWNDRETCPGCDGNEWQYVDEADVYPNDELFVVTGVGTMTISMDDDDPEAPF